MYYRYPLLVRNRGKYLFMSLETRAKRKKDEETIEEKRQRLQGRKTVEEEKDYYKQFPCKRFKAGKCEYGDECKYSHDANLNIGKRKSRNGSKERSAEMDSKGEDITEPS